MIIADKTSQVANIALSENAMESHQVAGGSLVISTIGNPKKNDDMLRYLQTLYGAQEVQELGLYARTEQVPNPDSRVSLSTDKRDALGMPLASLHWALTEQDWKTIHTLGVSFANAASANENGIVKLAKWVREFDNWPRSLWYGSHHMGTTRMHQDIRQGVVDGDCKLHGLSNLYIAGSSVFTTSGWANPTYTLVALAFRLAAKLQAMA